jgi:hypothetical protein
MCEIAVCHTCAILLDLAACECRCLCMLLTPQLSHLRHDDTTEKQERAVKKACTVRRRSEGEVRRLAFRQLLSFCNHSRTFDKLGSLFTNSNVLLLI